MYKKWQKKPIKIKKECCYGSYWQAKDVSLAHLIFSLETVMNISAENCDVPLCFSLQKNGKWDGSDSFIKVFISPSPVK